MRIAIVNDLGMAREALRRAVTSVPGHQVVWMAKDGAEAVERTRADRPDLLLMDLVMPGVDGVEATRRIMAETPCAILIVTATVSGHTGRVFDAMGHGALDAVDTPSLGPLGEVAGASSLIQKIGTISRLIGRSSASESRHPTPPPSYSSRRQTSLVLLGCSTGGPNALSQILADFPPKREFCTIVVQHVDAAFAPGLASWLTEKTGRSVELVTLGARPALGQILLAATNDHLIMDADQRLQYVSTPEELSYRPSVDVFFNSVRAHWNIPGVAALLTGMGRDGAAGLLKLREAGWLTVAQDQESSVVWGMPRVAAEIGAADKVLPITKVAQAILDHLRTRI